MRRGAGRSIRALLFGVALTSVVCGCGGSAGQSVDADGPGPDQPGTGPDLDAAPETPIEDTGDSQPDAVDAGLPTDAPIGAEAKEDATACPAGSPPSCDDSNDCTTDRRLDDGCTCVHEAAADGAQCDDHNLCTESDRCTGGQCVGQARTVAPTLVSTVQSFGDVQGLNTIVSLPSDDRAVFATGRTLTLVRMGATLDVLDRRQMGTDVVTNDVNSMIWVQRPRTFIVPLRQQRIAVVANLWGIDLYDISADKLTPSERYGFTGVEGELEAVTGSGSRVFTCAGGIVKSFSLRDTTDEILRGPGLTIPGNSCQGMAVSPDGKTLFVSTLVGLVAVDISAADGSLSIKQRALQNDRLLDVDVSDRFVTVFRLQEIYAGTGDVLVLDAGTLATVASFELKTGPTSPFGFAQVGGGLLLQQSTPPPCSSNSANLYTLDTTGAHVRSSLTTLDFCHGLFGTIPVHTVAFGRHAVLEPEHQIVQIDPGTGSMTRVTGLAQGSFERVRAAGPHTVEVHGPRSMQLVDITKPDAPVISQGGLVLPTNTEWLRLEIGNGAPSFLTVPQQLIAASGPLTSLYFAEDGRLPTVVGSIANEDPDALWVAAGNAIYQLGLDGTDNYRLRRFATAGLTRAEKQKLKAELDQTLAPTMTSDLDRRLGTLFAVDAKTGAVAVVEHRALTGNNTSDKTILSWFEIPAAGGGYTATASETFAEARADGLALSGGTGVLAFADHIAIVGRQGVVRSRDIADSDLSVERLLGYDEKAIYLAVQFNRVPPKPQGVLVLRASDLSEAARYVTPQEVRSVAFVGDHLVFGMSAALSVATPACPL